MRTLWVSVFVLALVLVVTSVPAFATHSPSALQEVVGVDKTGALYALFLPHDWNGRLVVYAHGFVDPAAPVALPDSAPVDVAPWVIELRESLLQAGYAVGYSSYAENGWAVGDGAERTDELRPLFAKHSGQPQDTYIIGRSLGELITMLLVHTHPHEYSGALALCGPVGGALLIFAGLAASLLVLPPAGYARRRARRASRYTRSASESRSTPKAMAMLAAS